MSVISIQRRKQKQFPGRKSYCARRTIISVLTGGNVASGFRAKDGQINVRFPAVNDWVWFLARPFRTHSVAHDDLNWVFWEGVWDQMEQQHEPATEEQEW